ncbi:hypothetical protein ACEWY4_027280 [Coilia grayii]|uniref:EGF-like domain-containing protein n=1 Tax=Coilia grayii TaxID=363190 RepID=A0ABD1IU50_9TELE
MEGCSTSCNGNGECVAGHCHCFPGFLGPNCEKDTCPVLCSGNGEYEKGRCVCHSGWKGPECSIQEDQCVDPTCSNHGQCVQGICICVPTYKGNNCEEVDCLDPQCAGHGVCVRGECLCSPGWGGLSCENPLPACQEQCSGHGTYLPDTGTCTCEPNWTGADCYIELCPVECGSHGVCSEGRCQCEEGWEGLACEQRACHLRCQEHGQCRDGKCHCHPGWEGEHCTIAHDFDDVVKDGCPGLCNGNGRCTLEQSGWHCVCQAGWSGPGCNIVTERECDDNTDNDGGGCDLRHVSPEEPSTALVQISSSPSSLTHSLSLVPHHIAITATTTRVPPPPSCREEADGLLDCVDPDCCEALVCSASPLCQGSPDPGALLQYGQSPPPPSVPQTFFQRVHFLLGKTGTHTLHGDIPFDRSQVAVVRGQVVAVDGTPLVGVNVTFFQHPEYGYTVSRQDGSFDLVTAGAISVTLVFQRPPFLTQRRTVWLPWNSFLVLDRVVMARAEIPPPVCDITGFAVQEEILIPGSFVKLSYLSTRTSGYQSLLRIILTHATVPAGLSKVHVSAAIEGRLYQKWYLAAPSLVYVLSWNKTDIYGQEVWGLTEAIVSVGYEYDSCPDFILWEKRTALIQGFEMMGSNLGGWSLDKHHVLNLQSGILHKGNGENLFISQQPPVIGTVMGNGYYRTIPCTGCSGPALQSKLFAPVALACGSEGSVYVGDFNFIRRILPSGHTYNILELNTSPAHKYYLAMDPVHETLYLSDTSSRKVYRLKTLSEPRDPVRNMEVVAGTGDQCLHFDQGHCGEAGKAIAASLNNPRGRVLCDNF